MRFYFATITALLFFVITGLTTHVFAQSEHYHKHEVSLDYYLPGDVTYDPDIPVPADILGFEVGEFHVRHDQVVAYMEAVANASDRVTLHYYGRSHEHRRTLLLTVTHPENHDRIDEIRETHVSLAEPSVSRDLNLDEMPVVVWLGYSVHGNEPSGTNAALLSAYYYAAAQGAEIDQVLRESVILIDPSFNPDGLDRFSNWVNSNRSLTQLNADPQNRELIEPWPRSRTNHYWFDLNRDWMPLQHPESRGRIEMYHHWKPNVLTDHHEMGTNATYFFQPGIPSRNNPLTPERNYELTAKLAEVHTRFLDRTGQLYYTKESFDDFYVGKGSTYPDLQGTIGILFEQASSRGHLQESQHGLVWFPTTILNQFLTSLSTVTGAHELRREFLEYKRDHYLTALNEAANDPVKAWVFGDPHDPARVWHLLDILERHQIQVHELGRDITVDGKSFAAGEHYIVSGNQPQYRMVRSLFETRTEFTDSLFYDVSTWSLPHSFNLEHAELSSRQFNRNLQGSEVESPEFPAGNMYGGEARYAYVFEWDAYYAPRTLYRLLRAGVRAKVANRPFAAETSEGVRSFSKGTVLVALGIQDELSTGEVFELLHQGTREDALDVYALNTGLSREGIDLGSPSFSMLQKPSVMLLTGDGVNVSEAGETWHQLDQRYHMPVTKIETSRFSGASLDRYNVLVMVNGNYNSFLENDREKLRGWIAGGGTVIAYKNAARWLANHGISPVTFNESERDTSAVRPYGDVMQNRGSQVIGGSIFQSELDLTHPLAYGYRRADLSIFRNSTIFMNPPENPYASPVRYTESPLLSGYISDQNLEQVSGSSSVVVSALGSGRIISMTDNPNFRAFWFGTNKLFANGVFFGNLVNRFASEGGE